MWCDSCLVEAWGWQSQVCWSTALSPTSATAKREREEKRRENMKERINKVEDTIKQGEDRWEEIRRRWDGTGQVGQKKKS